MLLNKTILVVEDDVDNNEMITLFFQEHFKTVLSALDGEEAYSKYIDNHIDIIITDIEMPKMNGIELVKKIRQYDENLPIFIITSKNDLASVLESVPLKLQEYILKPIDFEKLTQVVTLSKEETFEIFEIDNYTSYSFFSKSATYKNKTISLTNNEISLLELFIYNKNSIVNYTNIIEGVYSNEDISTNSIRILLSRLRKKLPTLSIKSMSNLGYMLVQEKKFDT